MAADKARSEDSKARSARQAAFYTKQRKTAESQADEGDARARATVSKINKKIGRKDREYTDPEAVNKGILATAPFAAAGLGSAGVRGAIGRASPAVGAAMGKVTGAANKVGARASSTARYAASRAKGAMKDPVKSIQKTRGKVIGNINKSAAKKEAMKDYKSSVKKTVREKKKAA